jgi:hypothetical protein
VTPGWGQKSELDEEQRNEPRIGSGGPAGTADHVESVRNAEPLEPFAERRTAAESILLVGKVKNAA